MKYDVIVNVGCSFMNGDQILDEQRKALNEENKLTPGFYLSKMLSVSLINLAASGSSNESMFVRIYDWVEKNKVFKNPLFIIGLSGTHRMRVWSEKKNRYYDLHPGRINDYKGDKLSELSEKITGLNSEGENLQSWCTWYNKFIYSNEVEDKKLQRNIMWMQSYLKENGCDYRLHNSLEDSLGDIKSKINYITFIDDNYKEYDSWFEYLCWQMKNIDGEDFENTKHRNPCPPYGKRFCYGHPSPNANKELAQRIFEDLK